MNWLIVFAAFWVSLTLAAHPPSCNFPLVTKLYHEISKVNEGNFVFSPSSLLYVLGLLQSGGKEATAKTIHDAFHLGKDTQRIIDCFLRFKPSLKKENLNFANKVYVREDLNISDSFNKTADIVYGAEVSHIDFDNNEEAADSINEWVEDKTGRRIEDVLNYKDLISESNVAIVNALHFKGNWLQKFETVGKIDFVLSDEEYLVVDMMQLDNLTYHEIPQIDAKLVKVPFNETDSSFTIVVPNTKTGFRKIEQNLEAIFKTRQPSRSELIRLFFPKFEISTKTNFMRIFQRLGIEWIFANNAVFRDLADVLVPVDKAFQKASISVDENGVEAAAATAMGGFDRNRYESKMDIKVDYPFLFYITIKGIIHYAGRILNPSP